MSLIARRLLLNRSLVRCSINSLKNISNQNVSTSLQTLAPLQQVSFKILRVNYSTDNSNAELTARFDKLVKKDKIVVFMKGTPERPMCGFSKAVCDILKFHGAPFEAYNVLADETMRSGIKEYTDWPTIPQIFFNGEFVGGCDILLEMHKTGDIVEELKKVGIESKAEKKE